MSSIIKQLPTVALRGLTILPGMVAHFDVSREKSIKAVEEAMMDEQEIFLLTQKNPEEEEPVFQLDFRVWGTREQIMALREYMVQNQIRFGKVE